MKHRLGNQQRKALLWFEQRNSPASLDEFAREISFDAVLRLEELGLLLSSSRGRLMYEISEAGRLMAERERLADKIGALEAAEASDSDLEASLSPEMRSCLLAAVRWGRLRQDVGWGTTGRFQPIDRGLQSAVHSSGRSTVEALVKRGLLTLNEAGDEAVPTERGEAIARSWNDPLLSPGERNWTLIPGGKP